MNTTPLSESELILNPDKSIYHLHLREEHIADTILLVGDQDRVARISRHFDQVTHRIQNREFVTHVGSHKGNKITVISTGIGTDNIDIVLNELNAAANIDFSTRQLKSSFRKLNMIRVGTSGAIKENISPGTHIISQYGLGFDGLIYYYDYQFEDHEAELMQKIRDHLKWNPELSVPYVIGGSKELIQQIGGGMTKGITATATGFYGPQGRSIGLKLQNENMHETFNSFEYGNLHITNLEMETSALYGLGKLFGHSCATCCVILANRITKEFIKNHDEAVDGLIETVLDKL